MGHAINHGTVKDECGLENCWAHGNGISTQNMWTFYKI